ncbi:hypothetical protein QJS10_CPB11g02299 [Acorus calamus]|uniref:Splicing factor 1 n=1 Tax=Acorus calamus TaxID=4465 RepID=A0AAV9DPR3_ACOCL|nr:hypothetical protein QJS10_CPB11g02299 [Acorus calamus]
MSAKVESPSAAEPRRVQPGGGGAATGPKVSMFGAKSGFVIRKNKLSGSLVPITRGGDGEVDAAGALKDDRAKRVQRKTKWGVDLTQDPAVRRARALAYQARVEQITKLLNTGALELGEDQESAKQDKNHDSVSRIGDTEQHKAELLELEKQEAIGEILRLNPSYKAPPDYKPLLKEAKVPIPIKAYPGCNFIGLILGSESSAQKRLENETGTKIQVYGIRAGTKEKREITQLDSEESQGAFEDIYVNISADTFEKVDAAVALIELLVTPVSGNPAVASVTTAPILGENQNQAVPSGHIIPDSSLNQGLLQPMITPPPSGPPQVLHRPYPFPWFSHGSPQSPMRPQSLLPPLSGYAPPPISPMPNNPTHFSPSNTYNTPPPQFGPGPPPSHGYGQPPRNPPVVPSGPLQPPVPAFQTRPTNQAGPPQNQPLPGPPLSSTYPMMRGPHPGPPMPTGHIQGSRPSSVPQPSPIAVPSPAGSMPGWSGATQYTPPQQMRPVNAMQVIPPRVPHHFSANPVPQATISPTTTVRHSSALTLAPPVGSSALGAGTLHAFATGPSPPIVPSIPLPQPPISVRPTQAGPVNVTPLMAPRPPHPSSGDFTFRPLLSGSPTAPPPQPNNTGPPPVPRPMLPPSPSFRPAMQTPGPPRGPFPNNQMVVQMPTPRGPVAPPMGPPPRPYLVPGPVSVRPVNFPPNVGPGSNSLAGYGSGRPGLSPAGGNQIYDPFSPTSASLVPPKTG